MPEKPKKKNLSSLEQDAVSRRKSIEANGSEISMPPVDVGAYLIDYLWDVGPASSSGMGPAVIAYAELNAWQQCAGVELQPWETRILRLLSADYVTQANQAEKPDCPAPYSNTHVQEFDRAIVARKVGNALKAFARTKR